MTEFECVLIMEPKLWSEDEQVHFLEDRLIQLQFD